MNPFEKKTAAPPMAAFCHRLSVNMIKPPSTLALTPGREGQMHTLVECIGPRCALFAQEVDPNGMPTGKGVCGDLVQAIALSRIAAAIEAATADDEEEDAAPSQGN